MAKTATSKDIDILENLENEASIISEKIDDLEIKVLLDGQYDINDAIVEVHSGAGGTEACDWADMLYRMYSRWALKKNYKVEVVDRQEGLEVGIKSLTMIVRGPYAYGYLKNEKGVHRLVRISPFDSNSRRHTSFASVEVSPVILKDVKVDIDEKDLRIDVYRSTGAGGQGVNTTDSAVRITHLPTKIVVTCQNERSQLQNKEMCMQILKSKLLQLEIEKKQKEIDDIKGEKQKINFGSQIRSYVMHPYSMVKDHRTNTETANVNKVLDGDIDLFINDNLKGKKNV
jgi:peptide chain release factor 2